MDPGNERADQGKSFLDSSVATTLNSAVCLTATASVVVGLVSWVVTFTPLARLMPSTYFIPFFVLAFPLFGWSICVANIRRRRDPDRQPVDVMVSVERVLEPVPRRARPLLVIVAVVAPWSFFTAIGSLPGQPEYDPGSHRYFYDDHGSLIPTTHAAYLQAVAAQNRLFLGVALGFISAAAVFAYKERSRRRELGIAAHGDVTPPSSA